jgi:hypothetical protein
MTLQATAARTTVAAPAAVTVRIQEVMVEEARKHLDLLCGDLGMSLPCIKVKLSRKMKVMRGNSKD